MGNVWSLRPFASLLSAWSAGWGESLGAGLGASSAVKGARSRQLRAGLKASALRGVPPAAKMGFKRTVRGVTQRMKETGPIVPPVVSSLVLPVVELTPDHRAMMQEHLQALSVHDRTYRFGFPASDSHVSRYVAELDFNRDELFGIFNRKLELIALAHLAYATDAKCLSCAEFGVSVSEHARGRGYGGELFQRAMILARNQGVHQLFIHALTENTPMLKIAAKHGAVMDDLGSETEAFLKLPPANLESRVEEMVEAAIGEVDLELKRQARAFREVWASMTAARRNLLR
jgi:GNAT superfamily N-acetyltransferase